MYQTVCLVYTNIDIENSQRWKDNLDWLLVLVLPVARASNPQLKCDAISSFDLTSATVTPARVIPSFAVSLIWIGDLDGIADLASEAPSTLEEALWWGPTNQKLLL